MNGSPQKISYVFIRPPDRRYTFTADLLAADDNLLVLRSQLYPSKPLHIEGSEVLNEGYSAIWFVGQHAPYEIGRFYRPDGVWTGYYININEPFRWKGSDATTLEPMIDLFLDLWITPRGKAYVQDEEEFEAAVRTGILSTQQAGLARETLSRLIVATERGQFPPAVARDFDLP